jgi:predicted ATP-grasp superfamily ATP-dependent carboligase
LKILLTDISSYKSICFIKALIGITNVEVFSIDSRPYTKLFRTKHSHKHFITASPTKNPDAYLVDVLDLIKRYGIDYLIPANSEEIRLLLKNRKLFGSTLDLFGSYETFLILDDKKELEKLTSKLDIKVPSKYTFESQNETIKFPIVYKPTQSSSSKGVQYIKNNEELTLCRNAFKDSKYVLQQYVSGKGVGYSVICKNGQIIVGNGHIRLAEFPISGGSSTIRGGYMHQEMHNIAKKICEGTNWTGFAMFEFKLTDNNEIYLIEINPRIWGSINQSIQMGVNFPYYLLFPEKIPENPMINHTVITYLSPLSYISLFQYCLKFNFKPLKKFLRNLNVVKADVSLFFDFRGYLSMLLRMFL